MDKYKAMTVNERLHISGKLNEFDKAVADKDIEKIKIILRDVELSEESIRPILERLGLDKKTGNSNI